MEVTYITIQNGNNSPSLYERKISKCFDSIDKLECYRRRVELLASRRFKRAEINVFFIYKEKLCTSE